MILHYFMYSVRTSHLHALVLIHFTFLYTVNPQYVATVFALDSSQYFREIKNMKKNIFFIYYYFISMELHFFV